MSDTPRFEHRILSSGEHCVTSPDVTGLCAVAGTEAEARGVLPRCLSSSSASAFHSSPVGSTEARSRLIDCVSFSEVFASLQAAGFIQV